VGGGAIALQSATHHFRPLYTFSYGRAVTYKFYIHPSSFAPATNTMIFAKTVFIALASLGALAPVSVYALQCPRHDLLTSGRIGPCGPSPSCSVGL
jgi:hypothetical protein